MRLFNRDLSVTGPVAVPVVTAERGRMAGVADQHGDRLSAAGDLEDGDLVIAGPLELTLLAEHGDIRLAVLPPVDGEVAMPDAEAQLGLPESGEGVADDPHDLVAGVAGVRLELFPLRRFERIHGFECAAEHRSAVRVRRADGDVRQREVVVFDKAITDL